MKSVAATETRRRTNAIPAAPVGNIEKSLCTSERLVVLLKPGKPEEGV
jgi:hypothetical protein